MARPCTGGQANVVLTPEERLVYLYWWLTESGLTHAELVDIATGLEHDSRAFVDPSSANGLAHIHESRLVQSWEAM